MAYTQADLDRLQRALTSGHLTTEVAGERITYHSISELRVAIADVKKELAQSGAEAGRPLRLIRLTGSKGL